jgi:Protein kinase domain
MSSLNSCNMITGDNFYPTFSVNNSGSIPGSLLSAISGTANEASLLTLSNQSKKCAEVAAQNLNSLSPNSTIMGNTSCPTSISDMFSDGASDIFSGIADWVSPSALSNQSQKCAEVAAQNLTPVSNNSTIMGNTSYPTSISGMLSDSTSDMFSDSALDMFSDSALDMLSDSALDISSTSSSSSSSGSASGTANGASTGAANFVQVPTVRDRIIANLANFGLSQKEFDEIEQFYASNKRLLDVITDPFYIKKNGMIPPLPRSLVHLPEGPHKGLYILLKDRGGVKEVGLGAFSRATLALNLETGKQKIFRSARKEDVTEKECNVNKITSTRPKCFASGVPVQYEDSWRQRKGRDKNSPKDTIPQEKHIKKTGFIMDFLEGGELGEYLDNNPFLTMEERIKISYKCAKELGVLHDKLKLVHFDLKPQNIFLTAHRTPRIGDFGFTVKAGEVMPFKGTAGYIAPELVDNELNKTKYVANPAYVAHPAADVWSLGCILADVIHGDSWYDWNGQADKDWTKLISLPKRELDHIKEFYFPNWKDVNHPDNVIYSCLMTDPEARPSASDVAVHLRNMYKGIPN